MAHKLFSVVVAQLAQMGEEKLANVTVRIQGILQIGQIHFLR